MFNAESDNFWRGKKVFLTGHTGFKGGWLAFWLINKGAIVKGYSLDPEIKGVPEGAHTLFSALDLESSMDSVIGDIRDRPTLEKEINDFKPNVVFHLAAQPLVRESYETPVETYETNVMGTVNLLNACRDIDGLRSVVIVTSDKCYENKEQIWGYRENDPMGGYDPYSNSKGCTELVVSSFRQSFFNVNDYASHNVCVSSARAGNVIGGGDWSVDRLITDAIRAYIKGEPLRIRSPYATRPWQHVLEPLSGYMLLAEKGYTGSAETYASGWNFGPDQNQILPVKDILKNLEEKLGGGFSWECELSANGPHEAGLLSLDCTKANSKLSWKARTNIDDMIDMTVEWYASYEDPNAIRDITLEQIHAFEAL